MYNYTGGSRLRAHFIIISVEGAYPRFVMMLMTRLEDAQWITSTLQSAFLKVPPILHLSFRLAV